MQKELAKTIPKLIPNKLLHVTVHDAVLHTLQSNKTKKRRAQPTNRSNLNPKLKPFLAYKKYPAKYTSDYPSQLNIKVSEDTNYFQF